MENFTPVTALVGGVLIGLSAISMMLFHGRIAGISGICGGAFLGPKGDRHWRLTFTLGLLVGPLFVWMVQGQRPAFEITSSLPLIVIGGLLVGFGTRLGSGCTSGHGVCGISRFSPRSIVATLTFMAAGMAIVAIIRHVMGG